MRPSQAVLSLGPHRQGAGEGSMHLAQVISDEVPHSGALALVVHLAQLPEGLHLHHEYPFLAHERDQDDEACI